ncbi:MAG: AAA family ATPase [Pyrinomonadaceae bacterium]
MSKPKTPFKDNWDHLAAEFAYLDLLLRREVLRWRHGLPKQSQDIFKTVYITDGEIDQLLGNSPNSTPADQSQLEAIESAVAAARAEIDERKRISLERGVALALPQLAKLFAFAPGEEQILMVCFAPEFELKYERIYAYLQDDISRRKVNVDLILRLLCASEAERLQVRTFLSPQSVLFRAHILRYLDSDEQHLPARTVKLDDRITSFLLGVGGIESEIASCLQHFHPEDAQSALNGAHDLRSKLGEVAASHFRGPVQSPIKLIFHFHGRDGAGKKSLAAGICDELGVSMLLVDLRVLLERSQSFEVTLRRVFREGILRPAAIYLDHFDMLLEDEAKANSFLRSLQSCVNDFSWLTFIGTEKPWEPAGLFQQHSFLALELPLPDVTARAELWQMLAGQQGISLAPAGCAELAAKFRLSPGQMRSALITARDRAHLRADKSQITIDDVYSGCRSQSNQRLGMLSRKLKPSFTWSDIVLPPNSMAQLREICAHMEHRQKVYGTWGFGEKHSLGLGLCVLLFGPSGTGKTMAAEIIANELNVDAYKIDLSTVVSKYIGETEKNLNRLFSEAETSNAILFFDEADALFGKRSEVKDAHDRYANIEINYLLQRMEEFQGLTILATNQRKNIDEAFFRRMHFAVEFPFPDRNDRLAIWKHHFPTSAPVADDIDFNFLAGQFNLAGGSIKNIVVNAAFLAAANSGVIGMKHVVQATRREFQKIGRLCTDADFAPYHTLALESKTKADDAISKS